MIDQRYYRTDTTLEHAKFIQSVYGEKFGEKHILDSIEMCEEEYQKKYWFKVQSDFVELIKTNN